MEQKSNKTGLIVGIIAAVLVVLMVAGTCFFFIFNSLNKTRQVKDDLESTINVMLGNEDSELHVYTLENDNLSCIEDEKLGSAIRHASTHKIKNIKINNNYATADVEFTTPNIGAFIDDCKAENKPVTNDIVIDYIENDPEMITTTVDVELQKGEEHWELIPNDELENAATGDMMDWYEETEGADEPSQEEDTTSLEYLLAHNYWVYNEQCLTYYTFNEDGTITGYDAFDFDSPRDTWVERSTEYQVITYEITGEDKVTISFDWLNGDIFVADAYLVERDGQTMLYETGFVPPEEGPGDPLCWMLGDPIDTIV